MSGLRARIGCLLATPYPAIALLALVVAAVPLASPERYLLKVLVYVGVNVIVIAGLALLFGYAGQISLGHAAFVGIGAYTSAYLVMRADVPWPLAVVVATLLAGAGGLLLALPSLRLRGHYLAMATLGFNEIMYVLFRELRDFTGGNDGLYGIPYPTIGGNVIDTPVGVYALVWTVALVVVLVVANIVRGAPGRAMRALHASEPGVLASGVDVTGLKVRAFALSASLAGLAGALYAHAIGFISPGTFGLDQSVVYVAIVVVGGTGSLAGPVIAAALLTLLPYIDALVPVSEGVRAVLQDWEADIYGAAMIVVVLFAPAGVAGLLRRRHRATADSTTGADETDDGIGPAPVGRAGEAS